MYAVIQFGAPLKHVLGAVRSVFAGMVPWGMVFKIHAFPRKASSLRRGTAFVRAPMGHGLRSTSLMDRIPA